MATQIIRGGQTVRVIVNPRGIASTDIVGGYLLITYTDGATENAGYIGGGGGTVPDIYNTNGDSTLNAYQVNGFIAMADDIDARLIALGV